MHTDPQRSKKGRCGSETAEKLTRKKSILISLVSACIVDIKRLLKRKRGRLLPKGVEEKKGVDGGARGVG